MPAKKKTPLKPPEEPPKTEPEIPPENEEPIQPEPLSMRQPDDVIGRIGPQAMALLAAGQSREHEGDYTL